jgi:hypothetical protein
MKNECARTKGSRGATIAIAVFGVAIGTMSLANYAGAAILPDTGGSISPVTEIPGLPAQDTFQLATQTVPYTALDATNTPVFAGTITSSVYLDPTEPDTGQPGLDFVYQITNGAPPETSLGPPAVFAKPDAFTEVTLAPFNNYLTDVNYIGPDTNVAPTSADRSALPGKNIDYFFTTGVPNEQQTDVLVVETNATSFGEGAGFVIDGGSGFTAAETPEVNMLTGPQLPEPTSCLVLAAAGTIALGRRRRRV